MKTSKSFLSTVLGVAMLLVGAGNANATIVIDDFAAGSLFQFSFGGPAAPVTQAAGVGGTRTSDLTSSSGSALVSLQSNPPAGFLSFSSGFGTTGFFSLSYGTAASGGSALNLDFTPYPSVVFLYSLDVPAGATLELFLNGTAGTATSYFLPSTGGSAFFSLFQVPLSDYVGAGLADVDSIVFKVTGAADADFAVDFISADVPEPATWALMGAGLIGIAAIRRRKRA